MDLHVYKFIYYSNLCLCFFCSIALFSSEEKGRLFVPNAEEKRCVIVPSKTGKLINIDIEAVKSAIQIFDAALVLA